MQARLMRRSNSGFSSYEILLIVVVCGLLVVTVYESLLVGNSSQHDDQHAIDGDQHQHAIEVDVDGDQVDGLHARNGRKRKNDENEKEIENEMKELRREIGEQRNDLLKLKDEIAELSKVKEGRDHSNVNKNGDSKGNAVAVKEGRNSSMYDVQYECHEMQRYGTPSGGWHVCLDQKLTDSSVVYSFGLGNDPSFDLELIKAFPGITVHAFDPTPTGVNRFNEEKNKPETWKLHEWGLHSRDEMMTFLVPKGHSQYSIKNWDTKYDENNKIERQGYRLETIMSLLGHTHIDICKIDVEGSEWDILEELLDNDLDITQLYFEFHFFDMDKRDMYSEMMTNVIAKMNSHGYKWYHRNNYRALGAKWVPPQENV